MSYTSKKIDNVEKEMFPVTRQYGEIGWYDITLDIFLLSLSLSVCAKDEQYQQTTKCSERYKKYTWSKLKHARSDLYVSLYEFHLSVELSAKMRNEPCWIYLVACTWHQVIFCIQAKFSLWEVPFPAFTPTLVLFLLFGIL